jgi:hypothetical protein
MNAQVPRTSVYRDAVMLESGVDYVLGMVGDMGFDYETIVATLRHFHFDGEKSVEWLLENGVSASRTSYVPDTYKS